MFKKLIVSMTAVVLSAGLLMAHGEDLTGKIKTITKDTVTITDKDNKDVPVMVDAKTKYMMGTKAAKMTDLKVGAKVAIDATMDPKMKMYVAESITGPAAVTAKSATTSAKATAAKATTAATKATGAATAAKTTATGAATSAKTTATGATTTK